MPIPAVSESASPSHHLNTPPYKCQSLATRCSQMGADSLAQGLLINEARSQKDVEKITSKSPSVPSVPLTSPWSPFKGSLINGIRPNLGVESKISKGCLLMEGGLLILGSCLYMGGSLQWCTM